MPGSVNVAAPSGVLPWHRCVSSSESYVFRKCKVSGPYADGTLQASVGALDTECRTWRRTVVMMKAEVDTFMSFYNSHKASSIPFYFYPEKSDHDPTGASAVGRNVVTFNGPLTYRMMINGYNVEFELAQVV